MTDTIEITRRRRGTVRGRLTRIEWDIAVLEGIDELTPSDLRKVRILKFKFNLLVKLASYFATLET